MYYSTTKLKEKEWNIGRYLKEIAIRNYGLCAPLTNISKDFTEVELKEYFEKKDKVTKKADIEIPHKPTEEELEKEYEKYIERTAETIKEETELLKVLRQVKFRVSKALNKLETVSESEAKGMVQKELDSLFSNIFQEIIASTGLLESLIKDCDKSFEEYKRDTLEVYDRRVKSIRIENEKNAEPSTLNLSKVYSEYVSIVNSLEV